jgi:hypothetical protein
MDEILAPLAFALLIGGQFLAAIVVISKRETIYGMHGPDRPTDERASAAQCQHCTSPDVALARLELARNVRGHDRLDKSADGEADGFTWRPPGGDDLAPQNTSTVGNRGSPVRQSHR